MASDAPRVGVLGLQGDVREHLAALRETGAEHMWLDARAFGEERWRVRFPTILASLRSHGIDPVRELIPVVPACHFASGGVRTDLVGRSSMPGLSQLASRSQSSQ